MSCEDKIRLISFIVLVITFFVVRFCNKKEYKKRVREIKEEVNISGITWFAYSFGISLIPFGLVLLLLSYFYSDQVSESFYSDAILIGTLMLPLGFSLAVFTEQKIDNMISKAELMDEITNAVSKEIIDQLTNNINTISDRIVEKTSENISLKIRPRPLRKEIAKQLVKSERFDRFVKCVKQVENKR